MLFDVHQLSNSTNVVTASDVAEFAWLVLDPGDDFAVLQIVFDGVSLIDFRVGESDSPWVMSDDIGDLVGANCFSLDLQELELGFIFLDANEGESSLNIIKHAVVFPSFFYGQHIHDSNWELDVPPNFPVNAESSFFIHGG